MFISQAWAQDAAETVGAEPSMLVQLAPLLIVFIIFYIIVIRPQSKRIKAHHEMLNELNKGEKVVTGGGIVGTIKKVGEKELTIEIAKGVDVVVMKQTVTAKAEK